MREIKFRAWHPELKEILPNVQNHRNDKNWSFPNMLAHGKYPIMQFTGLKDKNGKEIYEGDINNDGYTCEWDEKICAFIWIDEVEFLFMEDLLNCEVIGDIYSNPELLTNKK